MQENQKYAVIDKNAVNRVSTDDILAIAIRVKNLSSKDGKKKFKSIKAMMYLKVYKTKEDGTYEDKGFRNYWLDLGFTQDAFKTEKYEGCIVNDVNDLSTGTIYVNANYVDAPSVYKVTKDKDGKDLYPKIWVRGGIIGFEKYKPTQNAFSYHPTPSSVMDAEVTDEDTGEDYSQYTEESSEETKED